MAMVSLNRFLVLAVIFGFLTLGTYGIGRVYFKLTDGFGPSAIAVGSTDKYWAIAPLTPEQEDLIHSLLAQKYTYMAKGTQSYVLNSNDDEFVLKFFKKKHLDFPQWQKVLIGFPLVGASFAETERRREDKRERIFSGCKLAYQSMQQDSGIVYIHLNVSDDLPASMTIVDKLGIEHHINPNDYSFYIQRKGIAVYPALKRFKAEGDVQGAAEALDKLFKYMVQRSQRGILDRDPNYINNVGFLNEEAATLDVGNVTFDPLIRNPREYARRIVDHTQAIRRWIDTNFSELLPAYEQSVAALNQGE
ncbi:MAG: hypothetical protein Q8K75_12040 [Chlamydiales bacterium]|nr:hypothetical protein [Chlamydiales bacterium]